MAKGSINGVIKGKKGNTVFYRVTNSNNKEKQGLREYVPVVANPKTEGQLYQRAIVATIMRAYAAGKEIFDHSFQNVKTGGMSMNHFRKINIDKLRSTILYDVAENLEANEAQGRVVAPGVTVPVAGTYIISEGELEQDIFTYDQGFKLPTATENETVAAYAARVGLVAGDIFTCVLFMCDSSTIVASVDDPTGSDFSKQFNTKFAYVRLTVKENLAETTDPVATYGQLFTIEKSMPQLSISASKVISNPLSIYELGGSKYDCGSIGMIKSRDNERLRSNSTMIFENENTIGLSTPFLLPAWQRRLAYIGQSRLILEGGDL